MTPKPAAAEENPALSDEDSGPGVYGTKPTPYYADEHTTLYLGDYRDVLPQIGMTFDLIVADPPYGETSLDWDRWPEGWPSALLGYGASMWCFGSMRMFLNRRDDFADWKFSQEIIWEKHTGSGFATDRFRRVHEFATHWYRGEWASIHHDTPRVPRVGPEVGAGVRSPREKGWHNNSPVRTPWEDDGTRLQTTVFRARSMHRNGGINETEKPVGLLEPLISYACPPGGLVLDPFAGSCSTAVAARAIGRRSVCIEKRESQCEAAAKRLSQGVLDFGDGVSA